MQIKIIVFGPTNFSSTFGTQALMLSDSSNMILSPFSVKLLLSLLSEAAGAGTSTHQELADILPSIQTIIQARELYGKIFGSLLVSVSVKNCNGVHTNMR